MNHYIIIKTIDIDFKDYTLQLELSLDKRTNEYYVDLSEKIYKDTEYKFISFHSDYFETHEEADNYYHHKLEKLIQLQIKENE